MKKNIFLIALSMLLIFNISAQITFTNDPDILPETFYTSDHTIGVVDMNGDGKDDIIQTDIGESIYYSFQNAPNESFTTVFVMDIEIAIESSASNWGLAVGDINNDGVNELITGGKYNGIYIISNDGGEFSHDLIAYGDLFVQGINTFDVNNDGSLDIFSCNDDAVSKVFMNDEDGGFVPDQSILNAVTDESSDNSGNYGSSFTDIDNNGHCDLFIAKCRLGVGNSSDPRRINLAYMNDGEGNWTSEGADRGLASGAQSWMGAFGDMDNDGDMDLIVGNHNIPTKFYLNDGTGYFTDATEAAGLDESFNFLVIQGSFADFDNDGYLDFIMTGGDECAIAMNNGDGTFTTYDNLIEAESNSMALGDLNGDGFVDVLTASGGYGGWGNSQDDQVFINDGNDNNHIAIALNGTTSNINGVGARITLDGPWGIQVRDVKSGQSYGIQNSLTQYFGLGSETVVPQITVTWPSGTVDTYTNVDGNNTIVINEGGDIVIGVDELNVNADHLTLYPNPTADFISVKTNLINQVDKIEIFDANGKLIQSNSLLNNNRVDVKSLANGTYSYIISSEQKTAFTGTFIKE